jgi:hypothetical protein
LLQALLDQLVEVDFEDARRCSFRSGWTAACEMGSNLILEAIPAVHPRLPHYDVPPSPAGSPEEPATRLMRPRPTATAADGARTA